MKKSMLLFLFSPLLFAQFKPITDLRGSVGENSVTLYWTLELTDGTPPGGALGYEYEYISSKDGTFQDINGVQTTFNMLNGSDWKKSLTLIDITSGPWFYKIRILTKQLTGVTNDERAVIPWSNTCVIMVPEGLSVPILNLLCDPSKKVNAPTIAMRIIGDARAKFTLNYGTNPNVKEYPDYDEDATPPYHTVTLAGVFEKGDTVFFGLKAEYNGRTRWSDIDYIVYDPTAEYTYILVHLPDEDNGHISYLQIFNNSDKDIEMRAMTMGDPGFFGAPSPITSAPTIDAGMLIDIPVNLIFGNGVRINRRPILIQTSEPLDLSQRIMSTMGSAKIANIVPIAREARRDWIVRGLTGSTTMIPGAAISSINDTAVVVSCTFTSVPLESYLVQPIDTPYSFKLNPWSTVVFNIPDVIPDLLNKEYSGVLTITASGAVEVIGAITSIFETGRSITFVAADPQ